MDENERLEEMILAFLRSGENYQKLMDAAAENKEYVIDFSDLDKFNPNMADTLLESPDGFFEAFKNAVSNIEGAASVVPMFRNLPQSNVIRIRSLRAKHLGKLISIEGIVKSASEIKPQIEEAVFKCPECSELIPVKQKTTSVLEKPKICPNPSCRYRGRGFELVEKKLYDTRWIKVVEPFEITEGEKPSEITVLLKKNLTTTKFQKMTEPGNKIKIVGVLREINRKIKGRDSVKLDMIMDANYVERSEQDIEDIVITPEDEAKIKEMASDPNIYDRLVKSIAPGIYGFEEIKEAIALQLFGGVPHVLADGSRIRGDIHILLTGDPGVGKSVILKLVSRIVPRGKYVSGKGVSGAGLTATVRKDEEMGGWVLEAGALILANNGLISIDEFDKMNQDDMTAMHEAMSIQTVSIAKASIVATLPARTSVLAAANPKFGRFDPFRPILEQIQIPDTLMSRFDLKFVLRDIPSNEKDQKIVKHISLTRIHPEEIKPEISIEMLKKYIAYAKKKIKKIELPEEEAKRLEDFYVGLRNKFDTKNRAIPMTLRQYEALLRLAEASAKIQLRNRINKNDIKRAITIMTKSLRQLGVDAETGKLDIDVLESGISSSKRSRIEAIETIISKLQDKGGNGAKFVDILEAAENLGIPKHEVENIIGYLSKESVIYEPIHGVYRLL